MSQLHLTAETQRRRDFAENAGSAALRSRLPQRSPSGRRRILLVLLFLSAFPSASEFTRIGRLCGELVAYAEVVDRIAATVDDRVITRSEVELQIRVAAFQDAARPDLSPRHKQDTLQAMIDQKLIKRDVENSRYPLPDPAELTPVIAQFKREHFKSDSEYDQALASYGITDQDFRDVLLWEKTLVSFIEVRFETAAPITEQEISDYFEKTVKPAALAAHPGQQVQLEDYRVQIEKRLAGDRANRQMENWLRGARRRSQIVIHEEALQ